MDRFPFVLTRLRWRCYTRVTHGARAARPIPAPHLPPFPPLDNVVCLVVRCVADLDLYLPGPAVEISCPFAIASLLFDALPLQQLCLHTRITFLVGVAAFAPLCAFALRRYSRAHVALLPLPFTRYSHACHCQLPLNAFHRAVTRLPWFADQMDRPFWRMVARHRTRENNTSIFVRTTTYALHHVTAHALLPLRLRRVAVASAAAVGDPHLDYRAATVEHGVRESWMGYVCHTHLPLASACRLTSVFSSADPRRMMDRGDRLVR